MASQNQFLIISLFTVILSQILYFCSTTSLLITIVLTLFLYILISSVIESLLMKDNSLKLDEYINRINSIELKEVVFDTVIDEESDTSEIEVVSENEEEVMELIKQNQVLSDDENNKK